MEDLQFNHTQLLLVPGPTESDIPNIVQVTLNSETNPVSFEALARYHSAQPHLTVKFDFLTPKTVPKFLGAYICRNSSCSYSLITEASRFQPPPRSSGKDLRS
ncbi:hypothetical protein ACGC1H_001500 [Rhizoctonia solani]